MNNIVVNYTVMMWAAIVLCFGVTLILGYKLTRENRQLRRQLAIINRNSRERTRETMKEHRAATKRNEALEAQCARLDKKLLVLEARQHRAEQNAGSSRPYELAMKMASEGAGIDELVATGLSRGEAELALRMHGLSVG